MNFCRFDLISVNSNISRNISICSCHKIGNRVKYGWIVKLD